MTDPAKRRFRYGVQVNSLGLTEQQPENNAYRILVRYSVVLSKAGAGARGATAGVERGARPAASVRSAMVAETAADHGQAYETDLLEFGDLFDGSLEISRARLTR